MIERLIESMFKPNSDEELLNRSMISVTLGSLMKWYGGDDWKSDPDSVLCCMTVNGVHAQDDEEFSDRLMQRFIAAENEKVKIFNVDMDGNGTDIVFKLGDDVITMQAVEEFDD